MLGVDEEGGCHGPEIRGSGIMVTGMPFFKKVAGFGDVEALGRSTSGLGSEEEIMGLSVSRLWIKGFFDRRVRTPVDGVD